MKKGFIRGDFCVDFDPKVDSLFYSAFNWKVFFKRLGKAKRRKSKKYKWQEYLG